MSEEQPAFDQGWLFAFLTSLRSPATLNDMRPTRPMRLEICEKIRKAAEQHSVRNGGDIPSDMMGMCGIMSTLIARAFRKHGYAARVINGYYQGEDHCWVESAGTIYDVTLTQFDAGCEKVYWVDKSCQEAKDWQKRRVVKNTQFFFNWPSWQRPVKGNLAWLDPKTLTSRSNPATLHP